MKKFLIYLLSLVCILFLIPSVFTKKKKESLAKTDEAVESIQEEIYQKYNYKNYKTIKLYHSKSDKIEELPIDEYLYGVVSAEIPVSYNIEALKAQAVAARTYTLYQIIHSNGKHGDADICDNFACCQAWISKEDRLSKWNEEDRDSNWNKIIQAVDSTQGKIITYNGEPIDAFFHSNSGGITETASNVWGGANFPYLQSVETSGEDMYSQYKSEVKLTKEELLSKLKEKKEDIQINWDEPDQIQILEYTESGRVKTMKFGNSQIPGTQVRTILGLKSTNFTFELTENNIKFTVTGYGHGVGMSQTGADALANSGNTYEQILKHYYSGVEINYINET